MAMSTRKGIDTRARNQKKREKSLTTKEISWHVYKFSERQTDKEFFHETTEAGADQSRINKTNN